MLEVKAQTADDMEVQRKWSFVRTIKAYVTRPGVERESGRVPKAFCRDLSKRGVTISRVQKNMMK